MKTGSWLFSIKSFVPYLSALVGLAIAYVVYIFIDQLDLKINYRGISLEIVMAFLSYLVVYVGMNFKEHKKAKSKLKK